MTTIAYKNGVMVSDRKFSRGNEAARGGGKMFRVGECIVGVSGTASCILPLKAFLEENLPKVETPEGLWQFWDDAPEFGDWDATIVDGKGLIYSACDGPPLRLHAQYEAIGSGSAYAMGAMAAGASAEVAVAIACEFDNNSGGGSEALCLLEDDRRGR